MIFFWEADTNLDLLQPEFPPKRGIKHQAIMSER
jgi:hypothetical protein